MNRLPEQCVVMPDGTVLTREDIAALLGGNSAWLINEAVASVALDRDPHARTIALCDDAHEHCSCRPAGER